MAARGFRHDRSACEESIEYIFTHASKHARKAGLKKRTSILKNIAGSTTIKKIILLMALREIRSNQRTLSDITEKGGHIALSEVRGVTPSDAELEAVETNDDYNAYLINLNMTINTSSERGGGILFEPRPKRKVEVCVGLIKATADQAVEVSSEKIRADRRNSHLESLTKICARVITINGIKWRELELPLICQNTLKEDQGYYVVSDPEIDSSEDDESMQSVSSQQEDIGKAKKEKRIFLSSGTLVICPDEEFTNWTEELENNNTNSQMLRVLEHRFGLDVPSCEKLIVYEVVLISHSRFYRESLHAYQSPIFQIHWRRVILDSTTEHSSWWLNTVSLASKLRSNMRWLVGGLGVSEGQREESSCPISNEQIKRRCSSRDNNERKAAHGAADVTGDMGAVGNILETKLEKSAGIVRGNISEKFEESGDDKDDDASELDITCYYNEFESSLIDRYERLWPLAKFFCDLDTEKDVQAENSPKCANLQDTRVISNGDCTGIKDKKKKKRKRTTAAADLSKLWQDKSDVMIIDSKVISQLEFRVAQIVRTLKRLVVWNPIPAEI
ncbi:hypothetical protein V1511DRAFT_508316 [Dipodascopsis uninucleata]